MSSSPTNTPPLFAPPLIPGDGDLRSLTLATRWPSTRFEEEWPRQPSSARMELRQNGFRLRDGVDRMARADFALRLERIGTRLVLENAGSGSPPIAALYAPIGSEPDTLRLATTLLAAGVGLALPVDWSHGSPLIYKHWRPGDRTNVGPLGIAEPSADAPIRDPDVLFVPVAAFDRRGHRLGYGAGNVDRTIRALRRTRTVRVIGVAFAIQEVNRIPDQPHDEPVDIVVTDRDLFICGGPAGPMAC